MQVNKENHLPGRIYFSNEDDLQLLREVVGQNPYEDTSRWNIIQSNLRQIIGKFISSRTLKDRVNNLVKKFIERDRILKFQSGIEEEITELHDLLRHIVDLINELKDKKSTKEAVAETENDNTETITLNIVEGDEPGLNATKIKNHEKESKKLKIPSSATQNILTPTRRRGANSLKQSTLAYLTKKNERWYEIRCRELVLQERDKALKEKNLI